MTFPSCTLNQVSAHVYWFTPDSRTDRPSLAAVVGENMSLMLDIGASSKHTREFLQALSEKGIAVPSIAIATHWHWDHWFGIDALTMPTLAFRETAVNMRRQMSYDFSDSGLAEQLTQGVEIAFCTEHMALEMSEAERKNLKLKMPELIFDGRINFDLGGVCCQIEHVGGDHASDSCVMFIPEDEVLFLGDCFYPDIYHEPYSFSRAKLLPLVAKLENFRAKYYIEGHSDQILEDAKIRQWFEWIRLAYDLIDVHGLDATKLKAAMPQEEDAQDFLRDILAGETIDS